MNKKQNKIFIISGPSGAGEDSVIKGVAKKIKFNRIRTTITRKPRRSEQNGKPYFFITVKKFRQMIKNDEFVEWAIVYGNYRGATKKEVQRVLKLKRPVIWKIDWQGVKTVKKTLPKTVAILIAPTSYEVLEERLKKRQQDSVYTIKSREKESREWLKHKKIYDYIVVNKQGSLDKTVSQVKKIIKKEVAK